MIERFFRTTDAQQIILITLLFVALILQLALLIMTFHRRRRFLQYGANCLLWGVIFAFLCLLVTVHNYQETAQKFKAGHIPYLVLIIITVLFISYPIAAMCAELRRRRTSLSAHSVKEAFDNLPCGVCFFNESGLPVLCNRAMYRLSFSMSGHDIQNIAEVRAMLGSVKTASGVKRVVDDYFLPDGTVWHFKQSSTDENTFSQLVAFDVTELYNNKKELEKDNEQLKEISKNLRRYANTVQDATREQEILSMKMRIHEEIGSSLTAVSRVLSQNLPLSEAEPVISKWKDSVWMLKKENEPEERQDYLTQLCELCAGMNLKVITYGELPKEDEAYYMLVTALRVCATNAVRHANATELYAKISSEGDMLTAVLTNNGVKPSKNIKEGGGLGNLRRRIETVGGNMMVKSFPEFSLTARIPLSREVYL